MEIGSALLTNAFQTFLNSAPSTPAKSKEGATKFILEFLDFSDIKYVYDPSNYNERDYFDDCLSSCKDYSGRTIISLVADAMEHEGDGVGLRALRTVMIPYFLNRREKQTSKYAPMLLINKVYFMGPVRELKQESTCSHVSTQLVKLGGTWPGMNTMSTKYVEPKSA